MTVINRHHDHKYRTHNVQSRTLSRRNPCSRRSTAQTLSGWESLAGVLQAVVYATRRSMQTIWRLICKGASRIFQASKWLATHLMFHIVSPSLCFACIYLGVLSTMPLPASLWVGLQPSLAEKMPFLPTGAFPDAHLPKIEELPGMLLVAFPLAVVVFCRHHREWQTSNDPLLARMLVAVGSGVSWSWAWFNRWRNSRK